MKLRRILFNNEAALLNMETQKAAVLTDRGYRFGKIHSQGVIGVFDSQTGRELALDWLPVTHSDRVVFIAADPLDRRGALVA
jgi:hypothetical protein